MVSLKHAKVSELADSPDDSLIRPSDWNDEHVLEVSAGNVLLGRTETPGAVGEITIGDGLALAAGVLAAEVTPDVLTDALDEKADKATTYTKTETDAAIAAGGGVPIGASILWSRSDAIPSGFLVENGAAVSRTTYAALFAQIGTTYGAGDGATTFNLPDMRGEFVRGLDEGRGVDTGRTIASAQGDAMRNLTGRVSSLVASSRNVFNGMTGVFEGPNSNNGAAGSATGSFGGSQYFDFDASNQVPIAAEIRPRNKAKRFLIRAF